jgi:plasmid stability protein
MPSLQIRDLPEPLHRLLQHRAQAHKRSISQQALVDLEAIALSGDQTAEALIRADRER